MRDKDEVLAAVFAEKAARRGSPSACDGYYSGYTGTLGDQITPCTQADLLNLPYWKFGNPVT